MNLHFVLRLSLCVLVFAVIPTAAQVDQTAEHLILEDEYIRLKAEHGESHASGARDDLGPVILGNPTHAAVAMRVGLSYSWSGTTYSEFATRHHPFAEISHTAGTVSVFDRATGQEIILLDVPGTIVRVQRLNATGYHVSIGGVEIGTYAGPLHFVPDDPANLFRIEHIRRTYSGVTGVPSYRGMIELSNAAGTSTDRLHVVNIVEIEDYVPGVVANESIASFHMEALRSQAVAARGYAIANIGRFRVNFPYDIDDSSQSQVYRGVISEHPRAVQASSETHGLVGSYQGRIISALYSSSMGGATENNEAIFAGTPLPYLRGIYDGDGSLPDLITPPGISAFYERTTAPDTFDDCARTATSPTGTVGNTFSRWRFTMTQAQLRAKVPASVLGSITNVEIMQRMPASGRAASVRLTLSSGTTHTVTGWDPLRVFFRTVTAQPRLCGSSNIAANFTLNNPSVINVTRDESGNLTGITVWGGGWGHNVGMSQYGAHGRARAGQSFLQILKAYYTDIDVGSYPIQISRDTGSGPPTLKQEFYAPNAIGTLEIRSATVKGINIHINGTYDIILRADQLADGSESIGLSPYLVNGLNTIQYNTVGRDGSATVNVNVL